MNEGERIGISGTPSVYLNGKRVLDWTEEALTKQVEKALK
jgi:protein-disulfide isomerase